MKRDQQTCLTLARLALRRMADALEMWWCDHQSFPHQLSELVPNYLAEVPDSPSDEWLYAGGDACFHLGASDCPDLQLQVNLPRFSPRLKQLLPRFDIPLEFPGAGWRPTLNPHEWNCGGQTIRFCLAGPTRLNEKVTDWVVRQPGERVQLGSCVALEHRVTGCHRYLVHDGEVAYEFTYEATPIEWSDKVDRAFSALVQAAGATLRQSSPD